MITKEETEREILPVGQRIRAYNKKWTIVGVIHTVPKSHMMEDEDGEYKIVDGLKRKLS